MKTKLNSQQLVAVKHKSGPLLVIAGAGTGKTTVVTERIKYLVSKGYAKTSEILALTFTDKASREMEERVDVVMPMGYTQMWISTFHSFCDRLLRAEGLAIGLNTSYKLLTSGESAQFVKKNLFDFELKYFRPLGNPTKFIYGLLQHFSRLQDEDVLPAQYLRWVKSEIRNSKSEKLDSEKWIELSRAYKKYDLLKTKDNYLDFGDLITKSLELFRKRPNVLGDYQKRFKYLLVDEYQDTNISQNELVKLLAGKQANITVVADDDQSVYRFRGAAVSNVVQFRKTFPKTKIVTLTQNYRSSQEILDRAYSLIQFNNPDRLEVVENISKKLIANTQKTGKINFIHTDRVENEVEEVAKLIGKLIKDGYSYSDVAILARANNHAELFVKYFNKSGIPHQFLGPGKLFHQSEILEIIAYLKVLYDLDDSISLFATLSIDEINIDAQALSKLTNFARKKNISLYEACRNIDLVGLTSDICEKFSKVTKMVENHLERSRSESAGQLIYSFLEETGLLQKYLNLETEDSQVQSKHVAEFFDKIKSFEFGNSDASVRTVVDWIDLQTSQGESPLALNSDWSKNDAVNILTVHSSKGLEFPVVFLVNLVSQRFPTTERGEQIPIPEPLIKEVLPTGDHHIQEERRLFYVGMTRAKEKLIFTAADYYGDAKRVKKLSPFIFEALGDGVVLSEQTKSSEQLAFNYTLAKKSTKRKKASEKLHIDYLSYSQIQTFKVCPLHYKLQYLLRIPVPKTAPLSFGTIMHETMKDIYLLLKQQNKITKSEAEKLFNKNWINEGFDHKKHEKEYRERGRGYINTYLKEVLDFKKQPLYLEFPFVSQLVATKGERRLKIGGKIDRIDVWTPALATTTSQQEIEIIDYKTGEKVPTQKEVDKNEQLTFYALAVSKLTDPNLGQKPENIDLSLFYFEGMQKITTKRTKEEIRKFERGLFETRREIEESDFKCSKGYFCKNCEYKLLCSKSN